jgi:DNA polymerase sigma
MPYKLGSEKLEPAPVGTVKTKLSEDENRRLTADMEALYQDILPTPKSETKRRVFVEKLERIMNDQWPGHDIKVNVFGSSGNLLCTDESDGMVSGTQKGRHQADTE